MSRARRIALTLPCILRAGLANIRFTCKQHGKSQQVRTLEGYTIILACGCKVEVPKS